LVMATLGFNLIINIILIQWDSLTGGPSGFPGIPYLSIGSWAFDTDMRMYYLIWPVALVTMIISLNLLHSRVGRGLRALHSSQIAATHMGIRTEKYKIKVFVFSAVLASLAGSLYAHYLTFISPKTFDIFFSVELVTMVIVGGIGNVFGALLGTVFLTSLPNLLHFFDEYKDVVYGLILVIILVFIPEGAFVALRNRVFSGNDAETSLREGSLCEKRASHAQSCPPAILRQPMMNEAILSVNSVSVRFGGVSALADVSFDLIEGSITALIGPNGAGKTTMINSVSGVNRPTSGHISFEGKDLEATPTYSMAGMGITRTFQNLQIFNNMSVLENVMVGMHSRSKNEFLSSMLHSGGFSLEEKAIKDRAWECLEFFSLSDKADRMASALPYGDQKRLEMARAMASHPKLILLDEPVAGLNNTETVQIAELIRKIREKLVSVLLVEHDMNLVMGISDRIVVLNYGMKIAEGSPEEIQNNEEVLTAYLGRAAKC
jgi:branched-chain amino acid transport system permease protein